MREHVQIIDPAAAVTAMARHIDRPMAIALGMDDGPAAFEDERSAT